MIDKYYNDAIIGNKSITASFTNRGELLRFYYPTVDYKQFIDFFHVGVKVNDSSLIYLHDDLNNLYKQYYSENTNVLNTEIENTYFKLNIVQTDFVPINKDILIKRYTFKNNNFIDLELKTFVHSKIISNNGNCFGSKILANGVLQYNHNSNICTFSKNKIWKYQLNDVSNTIKTGNLEDKDYIGMSSDSAISFDLGVVRPGEIKYIDLIVYPNINQEDEINHIDEIEKKVQELKKVEIFRELSNTKRYWRKYVQDHDTIKIKEKDEKVFAKIRKIYVRSILLFPLLINNSTGGMAAAIEVDESKSKSGGYSYCWTRDAVFTTKALNILKMTKEAEKFYKVFCKNTQNADGMWEQRFYTNGNLAPCWGYQIDETASVIFGVYEHFKLTKDYRFLKETFKMCEDAIKFINKYIENLLDIKEEQDIVKKELEDKYKTNNHRYNKLSYDLWEMSEGIHLYSLSSIFAAYTAMIDINDTIEIFYKDNRVKVEDLRNATEKLEKYRREIKKFILNNMCDQDTKALRRNTVDSFMDVSIIGSVIPFGIFTPKEKKILNTVEKINMTLRTYTGGYLRFEKDSYMGGKNPWTIATLWMGLYYKKLGDKEKLRECLEFIVNSSSKNGFLAEQVENLSMEPKWVIGLGWAHAMFIMLISNNDNSLFGKNIFK